MYSYSLPFVSPVILPSLAVEEEAYPALSPLGAICVPFPTVRVAMALLPAVWVDDSAVTRPIRKIPALVTLREVPLLSCPSPLPSEDAASRE
ncbi:hypothetical protein D3C73_1459730 [compost metagenome]